MIAHLLFLNGISHKAAFVIVGHGAGKYYLIALFVVRPQLFWYLVFVVAYYVVGYVQYGLCTTVILFQLHHFHILIVVLEL